MLTPSELEDLRRQVRTTFTDLAVLRRLNPLTFQWTTVGQYPCRLVPRRTIGRDSAGSPEGRTLWHVYLPHETPVLPQDHLVIREREFVVTGSDAARSDLLFITAQASPLG